jgi:hypothetical protein
MGVEIALQKETVTGVPAARDAESSTQYNASGPKVQEAVSATAEQIVCVFVQGIDPGLSGTVRAVIFQSPYLNG